MKRRRRFLYVWLGGLTLVGAFVLVTRLFPDRKTRMMRVAPGRDVVFPYGKQLDVVEAESLGNAGAYLMRFPARMIAQYANGPYTFRIYLDKPPVRRGGITYTTEFPRYFEAKLAD